MADSLEAVLDNYTVLAGSARKLGENRTAELLDNVVADVRQAAAPYLARLSESEAILRSGRSRTWLRAQARRVWLAAGDAWLEGGRYSYRECVVPVGQAKGTELPEVAA